MLGKLLKYDFRNVNKILVIFTVLAFVFSIITRIFFELDNSLVMHVLGQILQGVSISMLVSLFINCFIRNWVRFTRNIYGDESYLTHTLPVKNSTIYFSKFWNVIITMFMCIIITIICLAIMFLNNTNIDKLNELMQTIKNTENGIGIMILFVISIFMEFLTLSISGFTGLIIGHKSNNGRVSKGILAGFVIYMIAQALTVAAIYLVSLANPALKLIFTSTTASLEISDMVTILITSAIIYAICIALNVIGSIKLLNKGVNVE